MSNFMDDDNALDSLRRVILYVASLDPAQHHGIVARAKALQDAMDRKLYEEIASRILAELDRLTPEDRADPAREAHVAASREIAEALRAAYDVGAPVLGALIALDRRREESLAVGPAVPESLRPPTGTHDRLLRGFADAAALYPTIAQAGSVGIAWCTLGPELGASRRNAALRRLRLSGAVIESHVPRPGEYPAYLIWLHAASAS